MIKIACLYGGCPRVFTNEEVKLYVNEELWRKYRRFMIQQIKLSAKDTTMMNCPYPDCDEITEVDPLGKQIFVECEKKHKFCSKCKQIGWHTDGKCENVYNK